MNTQQAPSPATPLLQRRSVKVFMQLVGFLACLILLGWVISIAFKPENRAQWERLREAPAKSVVLLLALSAAIAVANGLIFLVALRPVRKLGVVHMLAVNAIATCLAYLPFKLSAIFRLAIHNRRDRIPIMTFSAWMLSVAATLACTIGPLIGAGLWRHRADAAWAAASLTGIALFALLLNRVSHAFAGPVGLARVQRIAAASSIGPLDRFVKSRAFFNLHEGFAMLGAPGAVCGAIALRLLETILQAARFVVAAKVLGTTLEWDAAVVIASVYAFIGAASPAGNLGAREGGAVGLAGLMAIPGDVSFAVITLLVTAVDSIASLALAAMGVAYLRPDRLLRAAARSTTPDTDTAASQ